MDDLIAWLREALDDVQAKADACEAYIGKERAGEPYSDGSGIADMDAFPSYPWGVGEAELAYLAAVHPRVVLADVAAKRQIMDEHRDDEGWCLRCADPPQYDAAWHKYPCRTLRLLALPFADRPGFREEWKP